MIIRSGRSRNEKTARPGEIRGGGSGTVWLEQTNGAVRLALSVFPFLLGNRRNGGGRAECCRGGIQGDCRAGLLMLNWYRHDAGLINLFRSFMS